MELKIKRNEYSAKEVLGDMVVINNSLPVFRCKTLELPDLQNQHRISCIPAGKYNVVKMESPKYGTCFHILNVPGRDGILIHSGNYYTDILGCVLVGDSYGDINHDGIKDVLNSRVTLAKIAKILPQSFYLEITA